MPISLDPNVDPLAQGYNADGGVTPHVGGGLTTINEPACCGSSR